MRTPFAKRSALLALAIAAAVALPRPASANTYCVHTAGELQAALADAGSGGPANNQDNTVRIASGSYTTSGAPFSFGTTSGFGLTIEGGWNQACSTQDPTPGATALDGGGLTRVMSIQTNGAITIRHLTVRNGYYGDQAGAGAGIALNDPAAVATLDAIVVRDNVSTYGTGGLTVFGNGTVYIRSSLFTGNSAPAAAALSTSMGENSLVYLTNDTIAGNANTGSGNMITALGGGSMLGYVSNTVSAANSGTGAYDFYLYGFENVAFVDDAYASITGAAAPSSGGNLVGVNPRFAGSGDFHLLSTSPLLRAGTAAPAGGLPATDLEGAPRSVGGRVDIGAYEDADFIFAGDFEPL